MIRSFGYVLPVVLLLMLLMCVGTLRMMQSTQSSLQVLHHIERRIAGEEAKEARSS